MSVDEAAGINRTAGEAGSEAVLPLMRGATHVVEGTGTASASAELNTYESRIVYTFLKKLDALLPAVGTFVFQE